MCTEMNVVKEHLDELQVAYENMDDWVTLGLRGNNARFTGEIEIDSSVHILKVTVSSPVSIRNGCTPDVEKLIDSLNPAFKIGLLKMARFDSLDLIQFHVSTLFGSELDKDVVARSLCVALGIMDDTFPAFADVIFGGTDPETALKVFLASK